jgi:ubiquinol-cytochrome c reductase cytochrome c1 subunit
MPPPLLEDQQIEYKDGTYASKEQMIIDVVNFLHFSAEPEMENRKKMGVRTMIFLAILLAILVMAKRAIWQKVK